MSEIIHFGQHEIEMQRNWQTIFFFYILGDFLNFTVYMVCVNSVINPFVYAIQYHEFQQRVKEIVCSKKHSSGLDSSSQLATDVTV